MAVGFVISRCDQRIGVHLFDAAGCWQGVQLSPPGRQCSAVGFCQRQPLLVSPPRSSSRSRHPHLIAPADRGLLRCLAGSPPTTAATATRLLRRRSFGAS